MIIDSRKKIAKKLIRHLRKNHVLPQFFRNFNQWHTKGNQDKDLHEFINTTTPSGWVDEAFGWSINRAIDGNIQWQEIHRSWQIIAKNKDVPDRLKFKPERKIYDTENKGSKTTL